MNYWIPGEKCELLFVIVPYGKAESILTYLQDEFDCGATVMFGKGTRPGRLLNLLGLAEVRREIILVVSPQERCFEIGRSIRKQFRLDHPGEGIAFTIPLDYLAGTHEEVLPATDRTNELPEPAYVALCCLLNNGLSDEALEVANNAGASGATVIKARGLAEQSETVFDFVIEAEKEVLLLILPVTSLEKVRDALYTSFEMHKENTGILFSYPLSHVVGLYQEEEDHV